jgi:hypothetical protein
MLLSEAIEELQTILKSEGDCEFLIDVPERNCYVSKFYIEGKYYTGNYWTDTKPDPNAFLIVAE